MQKQQQQQQNQQQKHSGVQSINQNEKDRKKVCRWKKKRKEKIQAKYILKHPGWNGDYRKLLPQTYAQCALYGMFLLDIHAEMVRTWIYSHNTCMLKYCLQELLPQTNTQYISVVCFSHKSRSHRDLPQQTYAQNIILYRMFLLHIQAEIVPTRISSHNPVSNTVSKACFSSMSRLKGCRRKTPTNSCPLRSLCSSYTSKLKSCRLLPQTHAQYALPDVSLTHPGWNRADRELLPQTHAQYALPDVSLTHPGWNRADRELLPQTHAQYALPDVSLTHPGWNRADRELLPQTHAQYALPDVSLTHLGWNRADRELLPQTHAQYALPDVSLTHPGSNTS